MSGSSSFRRAKIVCTVGPATREPEELRELVRAGADAIRINFSHASHEGAGEVIDRIRRISREEDRPVAVVADLQGPKIRVGESDEPAEIREGEHCWFHPEGTAAPEEAAGGHAFTVTYDGFAEDLSRGDRILVDDGRIELRTVRVGSGWVEAEALTSGHLTANKGINLPGVRVRAPTLTGKDRADLRFALSRDVDFVALSFVRRAGDLTELREAVAGGALVISKIEKDQALGELEEIVRRSDGVMVARGDLGVELPYEDVPMVQKRIARLGQELARPSITATQMLESMTTASRPTRAEVSDVSTALLDGTDAVMLSAETAVGEYPVESVRAMVRIVRRTEAEGPPFASRTRDLPREERPQVQQSTAGAIAAAALQAVRRLGSPFLVTFTRSGFTARVVSAQRPPVPILAVTDQPKTYRQLAVVWGVQPVCFEGDVNYANMLDFAREFALDRSLGEPDDRFVVTAGVPFHVTGTTNMIRIEEL